MVVAPSVIIPGAKRMSQVDKAAVTLCLGGPSGAGKTTGAFSFFGGDYGKVVYLGIEAPQGNTGGGGATPAIYMSKKLGIDESDVELLYCRSWKEFQAKWALIVKHAPDLYKAGYRGIIWDGITEASLLLDDSLSNIAPSDIGASDDGQINAIREIVKNLGQVAGRKVAQADFGIIGSWIRDSIKRLKTMPFTAILTAIDGPLYPENAKGMEVEPIGIGPELVGRKLPHAFFKDMDFYFHCDKIVDRVQQSDGQGGQKTVLVKRYRWLTENDPRVPGTPMYFAKSRAGSTLSMYEVADGKALLKKFGVDKRI